MTKIYDFLSKKRFSLLFLACFACSMLQILERTLTNGKNFTSPFLRIALVFFAAAFLLLFFKKGKFGEKEVLFFIFTIGFLLRLIYINQTNHIIRQHDVYGENGHLAYILRFYNDEGLTDKIEWQYYQPPVWHYLCSLWLKFQEFLGVTHKAALENLQLISLFCSSSVMLLSYKLFRLFGLRKTSLCVASAIVAFHPTFVLFAGYINNDPLSMVLALLGFVLALEWYRNPSFWKIIKLALAIGFSMAVKVSGGLIALGVAILFAVKLFGRDYENKKALIFQFVIFGLICVPIALWWQFRLTLKFDMPFGYVPMLSETSKQYVGNYSVFQRLFDFSSLDRGGIYAAFGTRGFDYYEYNIPLGAAKTAVFGEFYIGKEENVISSWATLLFWSSVILIIVSILSALGLTGWEFYKKLKNKSETSLWELTYPLICGATMIFSYISFCFQYAHFCTMNFRYIAMTVVFGALYIGLLMKKFGKNNKMFCITFNMFISMTVVLFCVSSLILYGAIA